MFFTSRVLKSYMETEIIDTTMQSKTVTDVISRMLCIERNFDNEEDFIKELKEEALMEMPTEITPHSWNALNRRFITFICDTQTRNFVQLHHRLQSICLFTQKIDEIDINKSPFLGLTW